MSREVGTGEFYVGRDQTTRFLLRTTFPCTHRCTHAAAHLAHLARMAHAAKRLPLDDAAADGPARNRTFPLIEGFSRSGPHRDSTRRTSPGPFQGPESSSKRVIHAFSPPPVRRCLYAPPVRRRGGLLVRRDEGGLLEPRKRTPRAVVLDGPGPPDQDVVVVEEATRDERVASVDLGGEELAYGRDGPDLEDAFVGPRNRNTHDVVGGHHGRHQERSVGEGGVGLPTACGIAVVCRFPAGEALGKTGPVRDPGQGLRPVGLR